MAVTNRPSSGPAGPAVADLWEAVFESAPGAMALVCPQGRVLKTNRRFRDLTGHVRELEGQSLDAITHPGSIQRQAKRLAALASDAALAGESLDVRWRRGDTGVVSVTLTFGLTQDALGKVAAIIVQARGSEGAAADDRYRLLANNVSDVVALFGPDGACEYASPSAERVLGYSPEELLGQPATLLIPARSSDLAHAASVTARDQAQQSTATHLVPMRRKDGVERCMEITTRRIRGEDGRPLIVAVARDVTERVERDHRFHLIAENTSDIIVTIDLEGRMTFVSASCEAITGWPPEVLIARGPEALIHPDDIGALRRAYAQVLGGAVGLSVRWRGRRKGSDAWIWYESRPSLLRETKPGGAPELLDAVRDITAQVAQEEVLAQATAAAEAAAEAKAQFLANMSHEIRTPLTAVLGFADVLSGQEDLSGDARDLAGRIVRAGRGLLSIVNDVLDVSKLEAGQFDIRPRPTAPVELARDVLAMFEVLAGEKGLALSLETSLAGDAVADFDPDRARQILVNLVGNAVKFTDAGSVTVRMDRRGDSLAVEVVDTGQGLSPDECERLFQRFSQVDNSTTRRHGGTGLGLAISRGLAEAMGGAIGVRSTPGEGSCFHFTIAAPALDKAPSAAVGAGPDQPLDQVRILLADDNPVNRDLVRMVLQPFGARITEACDGVEAVRLAEAARYDLILMDVYMPQLDGVQAMQEIRRGAGPNATTPIVAFSAGADLATGVPDGFDGFVPKPIEVPVLIATVVTLVAGQDDPQRAAVS